MFVYLVDAANRGKPHHTVTGTLSGKTIDVAFRHGVASVAGNIGRALIDSGRATANFRIWGSDLIARGAIKSAIEHKHEKAKAASSRGQNG